VPAEAEIVDDRSLATPAAVAAPAEALRTGTDDTVASSATARQLELPAPKFKVTDGSLELAVAVTCSAFTFRMLAVDTVAS
jgi:hypothetical protein